MFECGYGKETAEHSLLEYRNYRGSRVSNQGKTLVWEG